MKFLESLKKLFGGNQTNHTGNEFPVDPQAPQPKEETITEKVSQVAGEISGKLENAAEKLKEKTNEAWENLEPKIEEVKEKAEEIWEKTTPVREEISEKAQDAWQAVKNKAEEVIDNLSGEVSENKPEDVYKAGEEMSEKFHESMDEPTSPANDGGSGETEKPVSGE